MSYDDDILKPEAEEILGYNGEVSVLDPEDALDDVDDIDEEDEDDELDEDEEDEVELTIGNIDNNY